MVLARTLTTLAVLAQFASLPAHAGVRTSGGGDAILCPDSWVARVLAPNSANHDRWDHKNIFFADTFQALYQQTPSWLGKLPERESEIKEALILALNSEESGLGAMIRARLATLRFVGVGHVELLENDFIDIKGLPSMCKKVQLAAQDFEFNRVRVKSKYYEALTPAERAIFQVHEALIAIRGTPEDTTPIRNRVLGAFRSASFVTNLRAIVHGNSSNEYSKKEIFQNSRNAVYRTVRDITRVSFDDFEKTIQDRGEFGNFKFNYLRDERSEKLVAYSLWQYFHSDGSPLLGYSQIVSAFRSEECRSFEDLITKLAASIRLLPLKNEKVLKLETN